jgi:hypothetical protein
MLCPYCQTEHDDRLNFCSVTGKALHCSSCGGVLTLAFKFCTICGTPSPNFPVVPVEKKEQGTGVALPNIEETWKSIKPPQEPVIVEEHVEPDLTVEQDQAFKAIAKSTPILAVDAPEPPMHVEAPVIAETFIATSTDADEFPTIKGNLFNRDAEDEPILQEVIDNSPAPQTEKSLISALDESATLESPIESHDEVEEPDATIGMGSSVPLSQVPLPSTPPTQKHCTKCGSVLPPALSFCTICGTSSQSFPVEPVEKKGQGTGVALPNIEETWKSIKPSQEPVIVEEPVESDFPLEHAQVFETSAESTPILAVDAPEPPVHVEEPVIAETLIATPTDVHEFPTAIGNIFNRGAEDEPILQEVIDISPIPQMEKIPMVVRDTPDTTFDPRSPVPVPQPAIPSTPSTQKYCLKCGSVVPRGMLFCTFCGFSLPIEKRSTGKTLLIIAISLTICLCVSLFLGGLGWIIFGAGNNQTSTPDNPINSSLATFAYMIFAPQKEQTGTPTLAPLPSNTRAATITKKIPFTPTATATNPPTAIIPSGTNTPAPTLPPAQHMVAVSPCASYYDKGQMSLKLACLIGRTWKVEVVDNNGDVGLYSSLAFDKNKNAHISYYDQSKSALKYAVKTEGKWITETVDSGDVGLYSSLVLDQSGTPWISYYDRANGTLKLAHLTGNAWDFTTVDTIASGGNREGENYQTSLVLDLQGFPLIAYHHYDENVPKLARWTGDRWDIQTIDSSVSGATQCSLALDSQGNPGVSYFDGSERYLKYAYLDGSNWNIKVVDKAYKVGVFSSLVFDSRDNPHISYFDDNNDNLKYAFWSGSLWVIQTIDRSGNVGFYPSLALDKNDNPYIAYYAYLAGDMRVANWDGKEWQYSFVDTIGKVGLYPSIRFMMTSP